MFAVKKVRELLERVRLSSLTISPMQELAKRQERILVDRIMADGAVLFANPWELRAFALQCAPANGLVLEFGVFDGSSIRFLAERTSRPIHGFDTFDGLPADDGMRVWRRHRTRRTFDLQGQLPSVPGNVRLHKGLFDQTLAPFLEQHDEPVAFAHVDCDLYSSTRTIFQQIGTRLVPGAVVLFDEYFNYEGWQFGEHRAFQEFVREKSVGYTILGVATISPDRQEFGAYGRLAVRLDHIG